MITDNTRGAILMTGSMLAFVFNDACLRQLGGVIPLPQILLIRGAAVSALLAVWCWRRGYFSVRLSRRDGMLVAIRSLAEVFTAFMFVTALFRLPFANASAILQSVPLAITMAGAVFLREPVGWRRLTAIIIGFIGVMLIVQPRAEGFDGNVIFALLAVVGITLRDLATRQMSRDVPSMTVAFWAGLTVAIFGGLGMMRVDWVPITAYSGLYLFGAVIFVLIGYILSIMVMRVGEIAFVSLFRYAALPMAIVVGMVAFKEPPGFWVLVGSAIVVGTGLFTLLRERQLKKPRRPSVASRIR